MISAIPSSSVRRGSMGLEHKKTQQMRINMLNSQIFGGDTMLIRKLNAIDVFSDFYSVYFLCVRIVKDQLKYMRIVE